MSWQFASHSRIKTIQAQSDIKAVHAQGTVKAVQAQAEIIGITKRVETVAKRLTRSAVGGTYWRKAAIEQAGLLDKMLDVAKTSENELLIAAVRKVFDGWAEGNLEYRAALDSGMTISECLVMVLEGKQPAQNISANSLNCSEATTNPVATTNKVSEKAASESSADSDKFVFTQKYAVPLIEKPTFWSPFWKTVAKSDSPDDRVRLDSDRLHGCGTESDVAPAGDSVCNADTGNTNESANYAGTGGCTYFGKTNGNVHTASGNVNALGENHANAVPTRTRYPRQDSPQKARDPELNKSIYIRAFAFC